MLIVTLKEDEQLYIGDSIVLSFYRHQDPLLRRCGMPSDTQMVKVAINAPQSVKVLRSEIIGRS